MPTPPPPNLSLDSLAAYPQRFVAACVTVAAAGLIWVLAKVLKWGLYLMISLVLAAGTAFTLWLAFHRG